MKRRTIAAVLLAAVLLTSCGSTAAKPGESDSFGIYYLNNERTALEKKEYTLKEKEGDAQISEILDELSKVDKNAQTLSPIPEGVSVFEYELSDSLLTLHFNRTYMEISGEREALMRAAVVRTFLQLPNISAVSFAIGDDPLTDSSGNVVGAMNEESFLFAFGEEEESPEYGTFTLYYASADGKKLLKKERSIYYSNSRMPEEVVLRTLSREISSEDGARPALSPGTKVLSVTTSDGICYVDLDGSFLNQGNNVSSQTAVYAIVDSLTALDNVNKVQILVNGEEESLAKEDKPVSGIYEADYSMVQE